MELYKGSQKIKDTDDGTTYGVYYGSTPIGSIYKGSNKIYQFKRILTWQAGTSLAEYIVPNWVSKIHIDCVGSKGYSTGNNNGGRVECDVDVTGGQTIYITVGAQRTTNNLDYNAADIRIGGTTYYERVVVAGGGGNRANWGGVTNYEGGNGGGLTGAVGGGDHPGGGGTQTSGGAGGSGNFANVGAPGAFGTGTYMNGQGGAGGAGWYSGGQGAQFQYMYDQHASGGGGGSSYTDSNLCSNVIHTQGYQNGGGYITITEIG